MTVALRPYQIEQVENVMRALARDDVRSAMIISATGSGKTTTAGDLILKFVQQGKTVLFLAHRLELIEQAAERFTKTFGLPVGIERGSQRAGAEPVVCASVQTLRGARLEAFARDAFDVIVIDECHHAASSSYQTIIAWFSAAKVFGITATADRADGKSLGSVFQVLAHRYEIDRAIGDGFLVPVQGVQIIVPGMDLSAVRQRRQTINGSRERPGETIDLLAPAGQARIAPLPNGSSKRYSIDLHPTDLGKVVLDPRAVDGVVTPMLELVGARRTMVFAVDLNHAYALMEEVCKRRGAGVARVVHFKMKKAERREIQRAHKAGEYQFLINVMLLTEGYDDPGIECVVMARPTMSRVLYVQAVGRALRLCAGKVRALLLDFVGVGCKFDLVGPEDVLGRALAGMTKINAANSNHIEAARRITNPTPNAAIATQPVKRGWLERLFSRAPATTPGGYTTRVVELIRGAKKVVVGWFGKLFR